MNTFTPGQSLVWLDANLRNCAISHNPAHCHRVSFRRYINTLDTAEVMSCRGSISVPTSALRPIR